MTVSQKLGDASYLLQRFVRSPRHVASVWPSSGYLARRMFDDLGLASGDLVIEFGPGTGALTREVQRLRAEGVDVDYLGIERDPQLTKFLRRRFPELQFHCGDAADVERIRLHYGRQRASAVVSGLPLFLMNADDIAAILAASARCLRPDGVFRTFSYVHVYPSQRAAALRRLVASRFVEFQLSRPVLRNLPPALTLTGRYPRLDGAAATGGLHARR